MRSSPELLGMQGLGVRACRGWGQKAPFCGMSADALSSHYRRPKAQATLVLGLLFFVVGIVGVNPAFAHTSLRDSNPQDGSSVGVSPQEVQLVFTTPVDPRSVVMKVIDTKSRSYGVRRITPDGAGDTTLVSFGLPSLPVGTYGARWRSVGPDGHQVAGEVVFAVGQRLDERVRSPLRSGVSVTALLQGAITTARILWLVALAAVFGSWLLWFVLRSIRAEDNAQAVIGRLVRRAFQLAAVSIASWWVLRIAMVARSMSGLSLQGALDRAAAMTNWRLGIPLLLVVLASWMMPHLATPRPSRLAVSGLLLTGTGMLLGLDGHAAIQDHPALVAVVRGVHTLVVAVWAGPLAVFLLAKNRLRALGEPFWEEASRRFFGVYRRLAGIALAVVVVSGAGMGLMMFSRGQPTGSYRTMLVVKAAILVIVMCLAAFNHRRTGKRRSHDRFHEESEPPRLPVRALSVGAMVAEVFGLMAIVLVAAALSGVDPRAPGDAVSDIAGTFPQRASDVSTLARSAADCAPLTMGKERCYQRSFAEVMRTRGADVAARVIEKAQVYDSYVAVECHQLIHHLGRDAARHYQSFAEAMAYQAYECASGYQHGVIEETFARTAPAALRRLAPRACAAAAVRRYSLDHYNCLHGLGHGLMLRFEGRLFSALPYCRTLRDEWERESCAMGVFMQNVISFQEHSRGEFRAEDPLYPCTAVEGEFKQACYSTVAGSLLARNSGSYQAAFGACDEAEAGYVLACYENMGRDISGATLLDPEKVVSLCELGSRRWRVHCYVGAALNAAYTEHGPTKASELCNHLTSAEDQRACRQARDRFIASF